MLSNAKVRQYFSVIMSTPPPQPHPLPIFHHVFSLRLEHRDPSVGPSKSVNPSVLIEGWFYQIVDRFRNWSTWIQTFPNKNTYHTLFGPASSKSDSKEFCRCESLSALLSYGSCGNVVAGRDSEQEIPSMLVNKAWTRGTRLSFYENILTMA